MRKWWLVVLVLALILPVGCKKEVRWYGQEPPEKVEPAKPKGPLFVRHVWKSDDSLSFLALYYAGRAEAAKEIEAANPDLSFTGALPVGTVVWIPERVVLPEMKRAFPPVPRPETPRPSSDRAAASGPAPAVVKRPRLTEEDLGSRDSSETARQVKMSYDSPLNAKASHKPSAKHKVK